jgi:hypothetical protein
MEKVVYLLGAGFSAPLNLPLMSDFVQKARDMYTQDKDRFRHFKPILDRMDGTAKSERYFYSDSFNIEDLLSILEMGAYLGKGLTKQSVVRFIREVIEHHTPSWPDLRIEVLPPDWRTAIFGPEEKWQLYGYFVASLHNVVLTEENKQDPSGLPIHRFICEKQSNPSMRYDVITLNYDLVLENACQFMNSNFLCFHKINFVRDSELRDDHVQSPSLAKLHGSVDSGLIIPPTWNKGLYLSKTPAAWKLAYQLLIAANHIRIIGYSLPGTDSYIKYILKAAVIYAENLKTIDVVCLDPDGRVKARYDEFIKFQKYVFKSDYAQSYLGQNFNLRGWEQIATKVVFDKLERAHNNYFGRH